MEDASLEKSHRIIQSHVLRASRELHFDYFKMGYETRRSKKYTGRSNPTGKSNWAFERNEEKSRRYTWRSNPTGKRNLAFERKEENGKIAFEPSVQRSKIPRVGKWDFA